MARPNEVTVLRRLVKAQDKMLRDYRWAVANRCGVSLQTPVKTAEEAARCRRWLLEIRDEALTQGVEAAQAEPASG